MDVELLQRSLPANAQLVVGDVVDTVPRFAASIGPAAPIGFVSIDLDYYSSTKDALGVLNAPPEHYLPTTGTYLDDIRGEPYNSYCGEQLAIKEFNEENDFRKIEKNDASFAKSRVFQRAGWIDDMFTLHVLDHPTRSTIDQPRERLALQNPYLTGSRARR